MAFKPLSGLMDFGTKSGKGSTNNSFVIPIQTNKTTRTNNRTTTNKGNTKINQSSSTINHHTHTRPVCCFVSKHSVIIPSFDFFLILFSGCIIFYIWEYTAVCRKSLDSVYYICKKNLVHIYVFRLYMRFTKIISNASNRTVSYQTNHYTTHTHPSFPPYYYYVLPISR